MKKNKPILIGLFLMLISIINIPSVLADPKASENEEFNTVSGRLDLSDDPTTIDVERAPGFSDEDIEIKTGIKGNPFLSENYGEQCLPDQACWGKPYDEEGNNVGKRGKEYYTNINTFKLVRDAKGTTPATSIYISAQARKKGAYVTVTYNNVGKYDGKPVGCKLKIQPFDKNENVDAGYQVDNTLFDGIWIVAEGGDVTLTYEFFYTADDKKKPIEFKSEPFMLTSFNNYESNPDMNSWIPYEQVYFTKEQLKNIEKVYFQPETYMVQDKGEEWCRRRGGHYCSIHYSVHMLNKDFDDYIAGKTFLKSAAIFYITGKSFSFNRSVGWASTYSLPLPGSKIGIDYDYYIDSACTDCDAENETGAYYIQDIRDWNAIKSSKNPIAHAYYKKEYDDCTMYCREEYKVVFPNKKNYINVDEEKQFNIATGRYFLINNNDETLEKDGIANFEPINITKIRQCQTSSDKSCLEKFAKNIGIGKFGEIELSYKETKGKEYSLKKTLTEDEKITTPLDIDNNGVTVTMTQTKHYILPENTYRYIENGTGKPIDGTPTTKGEHRDLKTSTIPVSFDNYATDETDNIGGNITLKYSLPKDDQFTKINEAFKKDDYFYDEKTRIAQNPRNIYYKYIKKQISGSAEVYEIENSACAKIFGYETEEFKECAKERKDSSTKACREQENYTCEFNVCEQDKTVCGDGLCKVACTPPPGGGDDPPPHTPPYVIYRTIDLNNPFPGQKGSSSKSRKTGVNWCASLADGKFDCRSSNSQNKESGNAVVKKEITNNRGVNGYEIYSKEPLYEVTLDGQTMINVRNYNKQHTYPSWKGITCNNNVCKSEFVHSNIIKLSNNSKCKSVTNNNLRSCAEEDNNE